MGCSLNVVKRPGTGAVHALSLSSKKCRRLGRPRRHPKLVGDGPLERVVVTGHLSHPPFINQLSIRLRRLSLATQLVGDPSRQSLLHMVDLLLRDGSLPGRGSESSLTNVGKDGSLLHDLLRIPVGDMLPAPAPLPGNVKDTIAASDPLGHPAGDFEFPIICDLAYRASPMTAWALLFVPVNWKGVLVSPAKAKVTEGDRRRVDVGRIVAPRGGGALDSDVKEHVSIGIPF